MASEVMAILCLSESLAELKRAAGADHRGLHLRRKPVTAAELKAHGAMAVLLKDALKPNLVQTLENNPAFIHGGPFANIAHGCNSVIATKLAMRLAEYTVTEAGFGADLGAEKFLNIKCRKAGISPSVVIVATVRALKTHGGVQRRSWASRTWRRWTRAWRTCRSTSRTSTASACRWWWRSTPSPPTRRMRSSSSSDNAATCR